MNNTPRGLAALLPVAAVALSLGCESAPGAASGGGGHGGAAGAGGGGAPVVDARPEGVALCYSSLAESHPATLAFEKALSGGDKAARAGVIDLLTAAVAEHPMEEELSLFLGLAHLWRIAEPLDEEAGNQSLVLQSALASKSSLEAAYALCPTDYRISAWLGPVLVNAGRAVGDQGAVAAGLDVLQKGIDHYASFVLFSKLLVYADLPATDPDFQKALDAVAENVDACGDPLKSPDPACRDTARVAHNLEGSSLFLGDVFAKAGRREEALAFYQQGKAGPAWATWGFQSMLADRIQGIDARIAASADADPSNDPDVIWRSTRQCAVCHTK